MGELSRNKIKNQSINQWRKLYEKLSGDAVVSMEYKCNTIGCITLHFKSKGVHIILKTKRKFTRMRIEIIKRHTKHLGK